LQSRLTELQAKGLGLAAISYDPVETLAAFSQQRGITFPLLSDAGSETIKRYGILNTTVAPALGPGKDDPATRANAQKYASAVGVSPMLAGIPFPGTFIVDRKGRVISRHFEESYVERNTVSSLLVLAGAHARPVTATKVSGAHLEVTTYSSDSAIAPGNRFSLVLDIKPAPGIHVYAPGAKGYRPIALTIAEQPHVRVQPVSYPPSEIYFFKPLNERVPTYQKPFTLTQEIVLDGQASTRNALKDQPSLTFSAVLNYQACDDRLCYDPAMLELSWTVGLRPIITEPTARPATK